jgi:surface polysaccharide O-acyltransferase-like enzyme
VIQVSTQPSVYDKNTVNEWVAYYVLGSYMCMYVSTTSEEVAAKAEAARVAGEVH